MVRLIDKLKAFLFEREPKWIRREKDFKEYINSLPRTAKDISYAFVRKEIVEACTPQEYGLNRY